MLLACTDIAESVRISAEPADTIPQGSSATYACTMEDDGTTSFLIQLPGEDERKDVTSELAERGIMLDGEDELVVAATAENNLIQVICREFNFFSNRATFSDPSTLTVIGMLLLVFCDNSEHTYYRA